MSFTCYKSNIEAGDTVIIYINFRQTLAVKIEVGNTLQTKYGALKHESLIGKPFGSKVNCTKGFVYALHPTPELWTQNLSHRTQILYAADIACICAGLELGPGSVVVEAGTGSGSLSHAILRTVAPSGHLFTFDFHQQRVEAARNDFSDHGIDEGIVTVAQRDVCKDGFSVDRPVDAVFIDLPKPWATVSFAKDVMKKHGGRFCAFSPCIEQTMRTCAALRNDGFLFVETVECLLRTHKPVSCSTITLNELKGKKECCETNDEMATKKMKSTAGQNRQMNEADSASAIYFTTFPVQQPTHTGYLTFATLLKKN